MPRLNPAGPILPMGGMLPATKSQNQLYRIFGEQSRNMPNPPSQQATKPIAPLTAPTVPQGQGPDKDGLLDRYTRNWHIQGVPDTLKQADIDLTRMTNVLLRIAKL